MLWAMQVECPAVTPEVVLKASGHVERFTDFMVTDVKTGDCHRADHLLKGHLEALLEDKKAPLQSDKLQVLTPLLLLPDYRPLVESVMSVSFTCILHYMAWHLHLIAKLNSVIEALQHSCL